jgi:hypothetical protein
VELLFCRVLLGVCSAAEGAIEAILEEHRTAALMTAHYPIDPTLSVGP